MRIPWRRLARAAIFVLSLAFLAALVQRQWAVLQTYEWQLAPGWFVLALVGLELTWLFELDTWRMILRSFGGSLPYRRAAPIWFLSNIIRYIPGNIWQFLGMAELAAEEGVPRMATFTSIVLHQAISIAAGIVLASLYFAFAGAGAWFAWLRPFLLLTPLGLFLLQPRVLERLLNWTMAKLHRPPLCVTLTWGQIWVLLLRYLLVWLAMGLSFAALARAVTPYPLDIVPYLVASWAAAYVIGFLSLLTPSGLGVREGILALLLTEVFAAPLPTVIAIVARLWMVLAELLGAGVALVMWRRRKPSVGQQGEPIATDVERARDAEAI
jgi:glycosyltransferase 2 family protein